MKQKPVAWRYKDENGYWQLAPVPCQDGEALYASSKELSDEEIMEIYDRDELYTIMDGQMYLKPIEFAKELLKKASER